jgi:hypothetical protein
MRVMQKGVLLGGAVLGGGAMGINLGETAVNVDDRPATKPCSGTR